MLWPVTTLERVAFDVSITGAVALTSVTVAVVVSASATLRFMT